MWIECRESGVESTLWDWMLIVFVSPVSEERLGRVQNGGIIVLLSDGFGNWWAHVSCDVIGDVASS